MKKLLVLTLVALGTTQALHAQDEVELGYFDNLSVGLSVGSDGIGFDVAAPISEYAAVRGGFSFVPTIKVNKTIHATSNKNSSVCDDIKIQAKGQIFNGKLLFDYYPFKNSSFHLTAGAFFGTSEIVKIHNTSPILKDPADYGTAGLILGSGDKEYQLTTDKDGNAKIKAKVNGFKPYIGLGFGRAVMKKQRFGVSFDMGVQFWGKPGVYADAKKNDAFSQLEKDHHFKYKDLADDDDKDLRDAIKTVEKITVYPVLNIRLTYRIFK